MDEVRDDRHPATADLRLPRVLAALADPVRLTIVRALAEVGESPGTELQRLARLQIGRTTFSHHQRVLREAGIVRERIHGPQRILSLRLADLDACFPGLLKAILDSPSALTYECDAGCGHRWSADVEGHRMPPLPGGCPGAGWRLAAETPHA